MKVAVLGRHGALREGGVGGAQFDVSAGDGAMLGVVNDSVDLAEDGSVGRGGPRKRNNRQSRASLRMRHSLVRKLTILELQWEETAARLPSLSGARASRVPGGR